MFLLSWPGGSWQATAKIIGFPIAAYLIVVWIALVFWTYRDIRQRSRDPIVQLAATLLVLVFTFPGHWVYLILRPRTTLIEAYERSLEEEALLQELEDTKACPQCKRRIQDDYLVCPSCGVQLKEPCRSCGKPLSYAWSMCPYCALPKAARERAQRPRQAGAPNRQSIPANPEPGSVVTRGANATVTRDPANRPARPAVAESGPSLDDAPLIDATRD